jgi:hypothetical protein
LFFREKTAYYYNIIPHVAALQEKTFSGKASNNFAASSSISSRRSPPKGGERQLFPPPVSPRVHTVSNHKPLSPSKNVANETFFQ